MALTDDFERAWRARFSADVPPELNLEKLDTQAINKALLECKSKITDYQRKLHQQEFIHGYLWDMLNKRQTKSGDDTTSDAVFRKDSLERAGSNSKGFAYTIKPAIQPNSQVPEPVEVSMDTRSDPSKKTGNSDSFRARQLALQNSINKSLSEKDREKLTAASKSSDDLSQPSRGNYVNLDYSEVTDSRPLERTGSDGSLSSRSSKKYSKPVPAPRPSIQGPVMKDTARDQAGAIAGEFQERLSLKRAQSPVNIDKGEEKVTNKFNRPRRNNQYESVHLPEQEPLNGQQQQPQPSYMHTFKPRTASVESSDSATGMSSFKPLPSAKEVEVPHRDSAPPPLFKRSNSTNGADNKPPKLATRTESLDSNINPESPRLPKKNLHRVKEHIYDAPVPIGGEEPDSDSSSDEEPIYFNILLLKQKTLQKTHTMYASVDNQKRHVENQARRLSKKFTQSLDLTGKVRPLPPKVAPPVMKPIREKTIIAGVTTSGKDNNMLFITC